MDALISSAGLVCAERAGGARIAPLRSRVEGNFLFIFRGMLPGSGGFLRGVHFWEAPFALMLSAGWIGSMNELVGCASRLERAPL